MPHGNCSKCVDSCALDLYTPPEERSSPGNRDQAWPTCIYTYLQRELRAGLLLIFPRGILKRHGAGEMVPPVTKARLQGRQVTSRHVQVN